MTATDLIKQSVTRTEIPHAPYSAALATELSRECKDTVTTPEVVEYWGLDGNGEPWRVHLDCAERILADCKDVAARGR